MQEKHYLYTEKSFSVSVKPIILAGRRSVIRSRVKKTCSRFSTTWKHFDFVRRLYINISRLWNTLKIPFGFETEILGVPFTRAHGSNSLNIF